MSDLQQRYGTGRPRQRRVIVVLSAILAVVFLVWLAWAAWFHSTPALSAGVTAFEVTGEHEVRVRVEYRADEGAEGGCLFRATAEDHTIVGERTFTVAEMRAADDGWLSLRTERRATVVEQIRCTPS